MRVFKVGLPLVGSILALVAASWWLLGGTERGPVHYVKVGFEDLTLSEPHIEIDGMAHYTVVIHQRVPGNLFRDERELYVFALFPEHDTQSRSIPLLVRSRNKPEDLVTYEMMTLRGTLRPPIRDVLPFQTEGLFGKRGDYFFADHLLVLDAADEALAGTSP
jgi:hypothetical protein